MEIVLMHVVGSLLCVVQFMSFLMERKGEASEGHAPGVALV